MSGARAPIFVLAAPFSGGSELCAMLGAHPALLALPSLHLFARPTLGELLAWMEDHPRLADGLMQTIARVVQGGQPPDDLAAARDWLHTRKHYRPADVIQAIAEASPERRCMVEWSFSTAQPQALARLAAACPQARFIHLLRDPGAHQMAVMADRRRRDLDRPKDADRFWLVPNLAIFEFLQSTPGHRHLRLQAEMLAARPRQMLHQLLEWLELPAEASLDAMLEPAAASLQALAPAAAPSSAERGGNGAIPIGGVPRETQESSSDGAAVLLSDAARLFAIRWNYASASPN